MNCVAHSGRFVLGPLLRPSIRKQVPSYHKVRFEVLQTNGRPHSEGSVSSSTSFANLPTDLPCQRPDIHATPNRSPAISRSWIAPVTFPRNNESSPSPSGGTARAHIVTFERSRCRSKASILPSFSSTTPVRFERSASLRPLRFRASLLFEPPSFIRYASSIPQGGVAPPRI